MGQHRDLEVSLKERQQRQPREAGGGPAERGSFLNLHHITGRPLLKPNLL